MANTSFHDVTQAELSADIIVTVLICTYNPRKEQFSRTLDSLSRQTLPLTDWEMILVDNNSDCLLEREYPVEWHPNARWLHEPIQGKPNALILGIRCAKARLIITVDDDNLLDSDYISTAVMIHTENPHIGAFGSGNIEAAYEEKPPPWFSPQIAGYLAIRRCNQSMVYKSIKEGYNFRPWGLGLCVKRTVAMRYIPSCTKILSNYPHLSGRKGAVLDDDLFSLCSVEDGLSYGIFPELRLKHLIEPRRVKLSYLSDLAYDHGFSHAYFSKFSGESLLYPSRTGSVKAAFMLLLQGRFARALEELQHLIYHLRRSKQLRKLRNSNAMGWNSALNSMEMTNQEG